MTRRSNYRIVSESADAIEIEDVGPWDKHLTVTNDAETVVEELFKKGKLPPGTVLTYVDSGGQRDQIMHDGKGKFMGFLPGGLKP